MSIFKKGFCLNKTYKIEILKTGHRFRYFVDDKKIHDYTDPEPHQEGLIGLALWKSIVAIDGFRVYQVDKNEM